MVTNGCFLECVWWQSVPFVGGYCLAAADMLDGDTAVPTDASPPRASAPIPIAATVRLQLHLDRVISLDSSSLTARIAVVRLRGLGGKH
jgi:hypothetical protein